MKYLHNHEDFNYFIRKTSDIIGLHDFIVEKDYWVTYILKRLMLSEFKDEFVFKGGTCLSKGYHVIERFSEDVDLLMLETVTTKSKTQKGKRLASLRDFISNMEEITCTLNNRSDLYATFMFSFPTKTATIENNIVNKEILLEPGYRGGIAPEVQKCKISSYVEEMVHGKLEDFDTEPFEINLLSLERIFIEKIFAIKEIFERDTGKTLSRKTRHYYDIYKLLQTKEVQNLLKNKTEIEKIVSDINVIGQMYYGLSPVTWNDLITHVALNPNKKLFVKLEQGYLIDNVLYNEHIEFSDIINTLTSKLN